jgi:hypothetical protein
MRFATFQVSPEHPDVVLTVIPLGVESRELLPNVNRWQRELGLPETPESELDEVTQHLDIGDAHADLVDLTGPPATADKPQQRTLAAIIPRADRFWYFKLIGPAEVVGAQKSNFDAFINSIRFTSVVQKTPASPGEPSATATKLSWTTPAGWRQDAESKPMRTATFFMGPTDNQAELIVTRLPANGSGAYIDNLNRWRGMLGLEPITDPSAVVTKDIAIGDSQGVLIELADAQKMRLMLVAIGATDQDLWFFRPTGPTNVVSDQRDEFETFLKSAKFE